MRAVAAVGRGGRPGPPALRLLLALLVVMCASLFPHASALSLSQYLVSRYGAPPYTSATLSGPGGIVEMVPGVGACIRLAGLQLDSVAAPDWPLLAPIAATQNVAMLDLRSEQHNYGITDLDEVQCCRLPAICGARAEPLRCFGGAARGAPLFGSARFGTGL